MTIVLDNIRSSWNVGSVIRTCDAMGADLILVGYTPRPEGATLNMVKKTSIGAENYVKWSYFSHWREVFEVFGKDEFTHLGIEISATSKDAFEYLSTAKNKLDLSKTLLWFGNEISGLSQELTEQMDAEIHLPMFGKKESLNVSSTVCAAGYLFLYAKS